jgi:protein-disulfide isomerase
MGKRQAIKARRQQRQRQQRITIILVVSGIALILAAFLMLPTIRATLTPVGDFVEPPSNPRPMAEGNTMGDPNAPVKLVEYSDFGCSHCKNFAEGTAERITEEYVTTGEVFIEYRSVGSLIGSQITPLAVEAAYCAGDQGEFWAYHDYLFANQITLFANPQGNYEKYFQAFAENLGLDMEEFNQCYDDHKYRERVQQDELDARSLEINSTPSFMINDQLLVGNLPYETFQETIEAELAEAGF